MLDVCLPSTMSHVLTVAQFVEKVFFFSNHPRAGEIRIAFVLYKHIGVYLSTENASMKLGSDAMATNYSVIVNSPVITAAISKDSNKVYLSDPVIFTIRHLQVIVLCLYVCVPLSGDACCFHFDITSSAFNGLFLFFFCLFLFYLHTKAHLHPHFADRTLHHNFLYP